jgi:hypothetical protein
MGWSPEVALRYNRNEEQTIVPYDEDGGAAMQLLDLAETLGLADPERG